MTDSRHTYDEQLPWLEPVDDDDGPTGVSARRMLAALIVVLLAAAIVAGTFYWLGRQNVEPTGAPELIRAEPGPYKVRPENPGGLDVTGESETAYETSAGQDPDAQLDLGTAAQEAPPASPTAEKTSEATEPAREEPAPAAEASGGSGSVVQLGAYKNAAQAQRGWDALSARFPTLSELNKMVIPFSGGYRLRAGAGSPEDARRVCQTLKAAGENCFVAN